MKGRFRCGWSMGFYTGTLWQLAIMFLSFWFSRYFFYLCNTDTIGPLTVSEYWKIMWYGLSFDLCAFAYFNIPFILMRFLPFRSLQGKKWILASDIYLGISTSLMLILNIADFVFVSFNGGRMRWETLGGILGDGGIWGVLFSYARIYWYLYVFMILYLAVTLSLAFLPRLVPVDPFPSLIEKRRRLMLTGFFLVAGGLSFLAIRGTRSKPLNIADPINFVDNKKADMVLNTPFTVVRTIGKTLSIERITYYPEEQLGKMRNDRHHFTTADSISGVSSQSGKNIMFIVLESGGAQLIDRLGFAKGEKRRNLFPFLDSLIDKSLVIEDVMATGIISNNGLNAMFMGFPSFDPLYFVTTSYVNEDYDTPAQLLKESGYYPKFYYGCNEGSFYIGPTMKLAGFADIVTKNNYTLPYESLSQWGIWDHEMAEFVANDISSLPQPFFAVWFTINAHSPFEVPGKFISSLHNEPDTPEIALEYTDYALKQFFTLADKQPWYEKTMFIITGDHGNRDFKGKPIDTPWIKYHIPFIVFAPDGSIKPKRLAGKVMSQFDIMPTMLHLAGYEGEFFSLGTDYFDPVKPHYAISKVEGRFMVTGNKYVIFTDVKGERILDVYDITTDQLLNRPLAEYDRNEVKTMHEWTMAFLQDYTNRILDKRMKLNTK